MPDIGLKEAIRALRVEIYDALDEADENLSFTLGDIELEFQLEIEKKADAGIKFWLANLSGSASQTKTHSVKFVLQPNKKGNSVNLSGNRPS